MKWEYHVIGVISQEISLSDILNEAGELGWELITIAEAGYAVFKRQKVQ